MPRFTELDFEVKVFGKSFHSVTYISPVTIAVNDRWHVVKKDFSRYSTCSFKWCYKAVDYIVDLYDRSVIASRNSDYINTDLAIETLSEALKNEHNPKSLILHSDQGVQFTSWEFVMFCKDHDVTQSMSRAGCPYDNAPMERFYNTFKSCFYYRFSIKLYLNMYNKY